MAIKTFTTGEVLTAADTNTYLANSGLVYVTSATATSGTTFSVNNCFTSAFAAYRIVIPRLSLAAGLTGCYMKTRAGGSDNSSNYYNIRNGWDYATGALSTSIVNNGAQWEIPLISDTSSAACVIDIYNPQLALKTQYSSQGSDTRTTGYGVLVSGGMLNDTTSYDGFSINAGGNTFSNITAIVYGYRKA
jgi:hypothetical protein